MVITIDDVLSKKLLADIRSYYESADFGDGRMTAGELAAPVKHNLQLPADSSNAIKLTEKVNEALYGHPVFVAATLPKIIGRPLFNRYLSGMSFGLHVDNALRLDDDPFRTDLSATLFISEPHEYAGGELIIHDTYGAQTIKLKAGSLIVYPSGSLHKVETITQGFRDVVVFWLQSLVRDNAQRALLYQLDTSIQALRRQDPQNSEILTLTGVYHNLLRLWADI
jgi:PKHD-type hydroxylase